MFWNLVCFRASQKYCKHANCSKKERFLTKFQHNYEFFFSFFSDPKYRMLKWVSMTRAFENMRFPFIKFNLLQQLSRHLTTNIQHVHKLSVTQQKLYVYDVDIAHFLFHNIYSWIVRRFKIMKLNSKHFLLHIHVDRVIFFILQIYFWN